MNRTRRTFVEQQEEPDGASAQEQMSGIKLEDIAMQGCIGKIEARHMGGLLAQDIDSHDTSQRVSNEVHTAVLLEASIVLAP